MARIERAKPRGYKKAVAIRKNYIPIIMELVDKAAKTGEPIVRSMEYEFPNHGYYNIKDQFMLGSNILVAPILEKGQAKRLVTLPKGKWVYDGKTYKGGDIVEINVTIFDIPIFQKSNIIF